MPPRRRARTVPLRERLALCRFVCGEFGYPDMAAMLARLRDVPDGFDSGGESEFARALWPNPEPATVSPERLAEYDANIAAHSRRLRMAGEHGRRWKPHQYLALLFTEHYLRRWFDDAEALRAALDAARGRGPAFPRTPPWTLDDLRTVAFQSATGSGKTLLMHAHILQYRHYRRRAGRRPNNAILVTPNEQLSAQHERELRESGLPARLFSAAAGADLTSPIEIIDLNKLAEKKGVKRVAVSDFGEDNLVLVDEGYLGAGGRKWREYRKEISRGGFTFEYSATFNQIAGGDCDLLDSYGKCLLFDYPYRAFHREGYGKDYAILNLPGGAEDENAETYLIGCLLVFYQQLRLWREKGALWRAFNVARPLCAFLGKTVTGSSKADRATRSDVARILRFLGRVIARGGEIAPAIDRLLAGRSGLLDETGADWFAGRFPRLAGTGAEIHAGLCETLFHGPGRLRVVYPTAGEGELHLRVGGNPPFGVVNVGDSAALYRLLVEDPSPDFDVEREMGFAERLFPGVDRPDSMVNVVVGARRFIAGWNSWRVSAMGLMHVGVGEGPEIVQMFGRGVRLKGWNASLKRHRECPCPPPEDSDGLALLETLNIFGLRADYMRTFRDLMEKEGVRVARETVELPVAWNFPRDANLKTIRLDKGARYERSDDRPVLPPPGGPDSPHVTLDLRSRLQTAASRDSAAAPEAAPEAARLEPGYIAFFDRARIHDRVLARKRRAGWFNLVVERETIDRLLERDDWYTLYMPRERLAPRRFADVRRLEDVAVDLVAGYAERFWRHRRRRWEHERIEIGVLDENDPNNIGAYRLSADSGNEALVRGVRELAARLPEGFVPRLKLGVVAAGAHAYRPLLYANTDCEVEIRPAPLDANERAVVEGFSALAEAKDPRLRGRELFLMRNLTRGRGLSFFDDHAYYPDFILWLKDGARQHMVFLDPKGLARYGPAEREKVRLRRAIRDVEARLRARDPNLHLRACVLSVTPPEKIGAEPRSRRDWEREGVWFLDDADCFGKVVADALAGNSALTADAPRL